MRGSPNLGVGSPKPGNFWGVLLFFGVSPNFSGCPETSRNVLKFLGISPHFLGFLPIFWGVPKPWECPQTLGTFPQIFFRISPKFLQTSSNFLGGISPHFLGCPQKFLGDFPKLWRCPQPLWGCPPKIREKFIFGGEFWGIFDNFGDFRGFLGTFSPLLRTFPHF